jgi:hypothetical protein
VISLTCLRQRLRVRPQNGNRSAPPEHGRLRAALRIRLLLTPDIEVYENAARVPIELREFPSSVLLPHIRFANPAARIAMAHVCGENAIPILAGLKPSTTVL